MPDKSTVRATMLAARRALAVEERAAADSQLVRHAVDLVRGLSVAAYVPMPGEPGGTGLVDALAAAAREVLLPVLLPDRNLDWVRLDGTELGPDAVAGVDLVLVPAVAVDRAGVRLGRGGGSYDRALRRVPDATPVVALLYEAEVRAVLPVEPHDRPVTAVLTPAGLRQLPLP